MQAPVFFLWCPPIRLPAMAKKKNRLLKGMLPMASSLLVASAGGPSALSSDSEAKQNLNDVLGKDLPPKPVNTHSDTGSPAAKKRSQPKIMTEDMEAVEDDQDSLEAVSYTHLTLPTTILV